MKVRCSNCLFGFHVAAPDRSVWNRNGKFDIITCFECGFDNWRKIPHSDKKISKRPDKITTVVLIDP